MDIYGLTGSKLLNLDLLVASFAIKQCGDPRPKTSLEVGYEEDHAVKSAARIVLSASIQTRTAKQ